MHEINDISLCSATAENKIEQKIIAGQLHAIRSFDMFIACDFPVAAVVVAIASPHKCDQWAVRAWSISGELHSGNNNNIVIYRDLLNAANYTQYIYNAQMHGEWNQIEMTNCDFMLYKYEFREFLQRQNWNRSLICDWPLSASASVLRSPERFTVSHRAARAHLLWRFSALAQPHTI